MSTTATFGHVASAAKAGKSRKSFFDRIIEARMLQARAHIRTTFERMSDSQLADIGFSPDQIRHVRTRGAIPADFWA